MISKYCLYPVGNPELNIGKNPYIQNLIDSLESSGNRVVNKQDYTVLGIASLIKYIFCADVFLFNWLESLAHKRFGRIQSLVLPLLLTILRVLGKKVVIICHNKHSHEGDNIWSRFNVLIAVILASKVIVHSKLAQKQLIEGHQKCSIERKTFFINHPVYSSELLKLNARSIQYDFIIWGAISPYKGLYEFLEFVKSSTHYTSKRILICGKVSSDDYYQKLVSLNISNVVIIDSYIEEEELRNFISISAVILFVYSSTSVFSSGALIKSLNYDRPIIGPRIGAFKELEDIGLIRCYNTWDDIGGLRTVDSLKRKAFLKNNTWNRLIQKFLI